MLAEFSVHERSRKTMTDGFGGTRESQFRKLRMKIWGSINIFTGLCLYPHSPLQRCLLYFIFIHSLYSSDTSTAFHPQLSSFILYNLERSHIPKTSLVCSALIVAENFQSTSLVFWVAAVNAKLMHLYLRISIHYSDNRVAEFTHLYTD